MTEHDVLKSLARSLRETETGASTGSGFTRARIMRTLHERRRRRISRWFTLGPVGAMLIGGTAWAQATGQLPELWTRAVTLFVSADVPSLPATAERQTASKRSGHAAPSDASAASESSAPVETASVEPPPTAEPVPEAPLFDTSAPVVEAPPVVRIRTPRKPPPVVEAPVAVEPAVAEPSAPEPKETPRDPEFALFREGHDLHFKAGAPRRAIEAYARYLERYPNGRFVPEARYNTALNLLEVGERERGKQILERFAEGTYGDYRREKARQLLEALR